MMQRLGCSTQRREPYRLCVQLVQAQLVDCVCACGAPRVVGTSSSYCLQVEVALLAMHTNLMLCCAVLCCAMLCCGRVLSTGSVECEGVSAAWLRPHQQLGDGGAAATGGCRHRGTRRWGGLTEKALS
jgi:hypothetical protein